MSCRTCTFGLPAGGKRPRVRKRRSHRGRHETPGRDPREEPRDDRRDDRGSPDGELGHRRKAGRCDPGGKEGGGTEELNSGFLVEKHERRLPNGRSFARDGRTGSPFAFRGRNEKKKRPQTLNRRLRSERDAPHGRGSRGAAKGGDAFEGDQGILKLN